MPSRAASSASWSGSARPEPLGPPTNATTSRPASAGSSPISRAAACSTTCGAFSGCTRPANISTTASAGRPSLRRASSFEPGWNTARSTPGLTVLTRDASAPYRPISWSGLGRGVGDQPVRGRDHLRLAADPSPGLGGVACRERGVLHLAQGVHGLHERNPPAFLGHRPHLAGQPVVRVHQVVPARRVGRLGAQHLQGELAQLGGQVGLVEFLERPGDHVPDQHAGSQLGDRRRVPADRAGEHLDLDAAGGQALGHLDDVHVQAAGIAGSWLVKRRRVDADGRDPPGEASRHGHAPPSGEPCRAASCSRRPT